MPVASYSCFPSTESKNRKSAIKSFLSRYFGKKHSSTVQHQQVSIHRFRRIKGSNIIQEVNPDDRSHSVCKTTSNYDMTILHEDELNSTQLATIRRRKKKIPHWAKKDQLQLAIINQIYFQDQNPEDIFGDFCIDQALTMINSIPLCNKVPTSTIVPRHFL